MSITHSFHPRPVQTPEISIQHPACTPTPTIITELIVLLDASILEAESVSKTRSPKNERDLSYKITVTRNGEAGTRISIPTKEWGVLKKRMRPSQKRKYFLKPILTVLHEEPQVMQKV